MAQYTVTHTCGHNHVHQIYGSNSKGQRDNKIAWLATTLCPKCYREQQDAKNAAANAKAADANKSAGLPELTGTPKQVAWAESIRAKQIKTLDSLLKPEFKDAAEYAVCQGIIDAVKAQASAAYWIDNQNKVYDGIWLMRQFEAKK